MHSLCSLVLKYLSTYLVLGAQVTGEDGNKMSTLSVTQL